jgi:hypothetical protein
MVRPKGANPITVRERKKLESLAEKDELLTSDKEFVARMIAKDEKFKNPGLSSTTIKHLMSRYAWERYNKRVPSIDTARSYTKKGNLMEDEAIEIVSELDGHKYIKEDSCVSNDYLIGVCDVYHNDSRKIIDVKASWNIYTFMPNLITPVSKNYWYQMQGYMELYDADVAEVCYVLVNTPPHLISREREKLSDRYMMGEIAKDKYTELLMGLEHSFDYSKIPIRRRVIRQIIPRYREIMPVIYSNVINCREWLNEFEKIHLNNKPILILPDEYVKLQKDDDNPEPDTADAR